MTISTGIISTIAGNGAYSYIGDGSAATSANLFEPTSVAVDTSGNIYVADYANNRVRKVTISTGIISTIAGTGSCDDNYGSGGAATSATLCRPADVALDASGRRQPTLLLISLLIALHTMPLLR